jgi:hypothetical protein
MHVKRPTGHGKVYVAMLNVFLYLYQMTW